MQDGYTALNVAALEGHGGIVQALIDLKVPVNARSRKDGWTALHLAAQEGHVEIVRILLAADTDVNVADNVRTRV